MKLWFSLNEFHENNTQTCKLKLSRGSWTAVHFSVEEFYLTWIFSGSKFVHFNKLDKQLTFSGLVNYEL